MNEIFASVTNQMIQKNHDQCCNIIRIKIQQGRNMENNNRIIKYFNKFKFKTFNY